MKGRGRRKKKRGKKGGREEGKERGRKEFIALEKKVKEAAFSS